MEELRRIREERGWTQRRLADESGVNKATINQIERGRRSPNVETLGRLADALNAEIGDMFPKVQSQLPLEEDRESVESERRVIEGLIGPWVGWLERDAAYLTADTHAEGLDRGAHAKILADRRNTLQALDELGTTLERLGIDWTDRRNHAMRRAHRDLQAAFDDWTDAWLEARTTYLDSLAGSELAQARRAQDEGEERSENIPEWLRAG